MATLYPQTKGCGANTEDAIGGLCGEVTSKYQEIMGMIRQKWTEKEPPRDGRIPRIGQAEAQKVINTCARLLENIGFAVRRNARAINTKLKKKEAEGVIQAAEDLCKASYQMRRPYNNIEDAMDRFKKKLKEAFKYVKEIDGAIKKEKDPSVASVKTSIRQCLVRLKDKAEQYKKKMEADEARENELKGIKAEKSAAESEDDEDDDDEDDDDED